MAFYKFIEFYAKIHFPSSAERENGIVCQVNILNGKLTYVSHVDREGPVASEKILFRELGQDLLIGGRGLQSLMICINHCGFSLCGNVHNFTCAEGSE